MTISKSARIGILAACLLGSGAADARELSGQFSVLDQIPRVRPEFQVPDEPNQLFYIERSVNSNTVIYAAGLDADGQIDPRNPVKAFWRWYNVDGHKKDLNFIEKLLAYGVRVERRRAGEPVTFTIAALPDYKLMLELDDQKRPEALVRIGDHLVKLVYIYLQVIDGVIPQVPSSELFGIDKVTGKAIHEHIVTK